jgi:hypothetical protein
MLSRCLQGRSQNSIAVTAHHQPRNVPSDHELTRLNLDQRDGFSVARNPCTALHPNLEEGAGGGSRRGILCGPGGAAHQVRAFVKS